MTLQKKSRQHNYIPTVQQNFSMNQNTVAFPTKQHNFGLWATIGFVIICFSGIMIFYVSLIQQNNSYGYQFNQIKAEQTALEAEQQDLEVENARIQSLANVRNSEVAANMTTPASIDSVE